MESVGVVEVEELMRNLSTTSIGFVDTDVAVDAFVVVVAVEGTDTDKLAGLVVDIAADDTGSSRVHYLDVVADILCVALFDGEPAGDTVELIVAAAAVVVAEDREIPRHYCPEIHLVVAEVEGGDSIIGCHCDGRGD